MAAVFKEGEKPHQPLPKGLVMDEKEHSWHDFSDLPRGLIILPWLVWAFVIISIAGVMKFAYADSVMVFRDQDQNSLTLYEGPCPLGGWFKEWRKAKWVWMGEVQEACWRVQSTPQGPMVQTVDSAGETGQVAPQEFSKEEGV